MYYFFLEKQHFRDPSWIEGQLGKEEHEEEEKTIFQVSWFSLDLALLPIQFYPFNFVLNHNVSLETSFSLNPSLQIILRLIHYYSLCFLIYFLIYDNVNFLLIRLTIILKIANLKKSLAFEPYMCRLQMNQVLVPVWIRY